MNTGESANGLECRHTAGDAAWRTLYPFVSRQLTLEAGRVHYVDEGVCSTPPAADPARKSRETLLLVHGNPTWSFHWRHLIASLSGECRVVALDQLGCGLSDRLGPRPVRLADRIEHLVEFIDRLDLRHTTLVAHDWGGAVGLGAALERPERFVRCVLLNTGAFPPWYLPWQLAALKLPFAGRLAIQGMNLFLRGALATTVVDRRCLTDQVRQGYLVPHRSWSDRRSIYEFVRDIPRSRNHPTYGTLERIEARLRELAHLPFLFVWGMQDWCFRPDCLDRFLRHFPAARVTRLENAGHWVMEDAPSEVVCSVREFLHSTLRDVVAAEASVRT